MPERRLRLLSKWKAVVTKVASAIKERYPNAEIYVFGGAAEGRLTAVSDVDLAVVLENPPKDRAGMLAEVWEILESEGIPQYYPLEIHILSKAEFRKLKGTKIKLA